MLRFGFILAFCLSFVSFAQNRVFVPTDTIKGHFDQFSVDNLGRIYLTKEDVIIQFDKNLDTLFSASLKSIRPSSIESSKSFRTLLFDEERSVIQFLDNTLTDIHGDIDLVNQDIQQPILVCESFGGNTIWILDAASLRLIKMNDKLEKVIITENLISIFDETTLPSKMMEVNDLLYVMIPKKGVALFDVFGTFMNLYECDPISIDAVDDYLLIQTEESLKVVSTKGILEEESNYPYPEGVIDLEYTHKKVFFLMPDMLLIGKYVTDKK